VLVGGSGNDLVIGGPGRNLMTGGFGLDGFTESHADVRDTGTAFVGFANDLALDR
jgi:hypothetical protein